MAGKTPLERPVITDAMLALPVLKGNVCYIKMCLKMPSKLKTTLASLEQGCSWRLTLLKRIKWVY